MKRDPDIEAHVALLSTEDGGRQGPAFSGYRPNHLVTENYLTSGTHEYIGVDQLEPGSSTIANITFVSPEFYPNCLTVGQTINVQEGGKIVGYATIRKIFNPLLEKSEGTDNNTL